MPLDTLLALLIFALTTSITPGPNNMMLFASGVNFGFRRTIPHMLGIGAGFFALLIGVGFGLGALLKTVPLLYTVLKFAGGAYLVWIAWKIATSRALAEGQAGAKPMTFLGAAAFQWVNPKAWVMAVTAIATYTDTRQYLSHRAGGRCHLRAGQRAERFDLGRFRLGLARLAVRSGAAEMVQHHHGGAAGLEPVADVALTGADTIQGEGDERSPSS